MAVKRGKKSTRKVKSLATKNVTAKHAKSVKGGDRLGNFEIQQLMSNYNAAAKK